jgi:hypothetical protein
MLVHGLDKDDGSQRREPKCADDQRQAKFGTTHPNRTTERADDCPEYASVLEYSNARPARRYSGMQRRQAPRS